MNGSSHGMDAELRGRLASLGVNRALIIDDAFDDPTFESIRDRLPGFWASVEVDPDALQELQRMRPQVQAVEDVDAAVVSELWAQLESSEHLKSHLLELFGTKLGDRSVLDRLVAFLRGLGVEPVTQGTDAADVDATGGARLVFIDYYLGPTDESGIAASRARARSLYEHYSKNGGAPFIVLMSSQREAASASDMFRQSSGLLRGLFAFVSKADFSRSDLLHYHVSAWAFALPVREQIQRFVETVEAALPKVQEKFIDYVRSLGFEDYANIQWLCLQEDGQPLGEYMLWLYRNLLGNLLQEHSTVQALQKELDAMEFDAFTPSQLAPTPELAEIYSRAVTEPNVGELGPHPREKAVAMPRPDEPWVHPFVPAYLALGDLFFNREDKRVLAVINAACDLSYAPSRKRQVPRDRSILFLQGTLERYDELAASDTLRTELIEYDRHAYRISWDRDLVASVPYSEVQAWLEDRGYVRKARLSLPYVMQLQYAFTAGVSRVGMPVRPPVYRRVAVEVYGAGSGGEFRRFGDPINEGAVVIARRRGGKPDEHTFVLTLDCMIRTQERLEAVEEDAVTLLEMVKMQPVPEEPQAAKQARQRLRALETRLERVRALRGLSPVWKSVVHAPTPLPESTKAKNINDADLLHVLRDVPVGEVKVEGAVVLRLVLDEPS